MKPSSSLSDFIIPIIYVLSLIVLAVLLWKLVHPILSVAITAIIIYIFQLRKLLSGKDK
ncbi:MAG: hypothetical protein Q8O84_02655 [Nanoarchaeota archaeon]|nr:hypothetical protein [Nanoarchaeota archaeon]